jgi:hypothetical protein
VRKILGALVVAAFLSSVPVPVRAASPAPASCKRHKKAKLVRPGKYKVPKYKVKKAGKRHRVKVRTSVAASPKQI